MFISLYLPKEGLLWVIVFLLSTVDKYLTLRRIWYVLELPIEYNLTLESRCKLPENERGSKYIYLYWMLLVSKMLS